MNDEEKITAIRDVLWACRTVYFPNDAITDTVWATHPDTGIVHTTLLDVLCMALSDLGIDCDKAIDVEFDEEKVLAGCWKEPRS